MADVFISYKREQRHFAKALAEAIAAQGYSVWWDVDLLPGTNFAHEIEAVIQQAKAAVVLWSYESVKSPWVVEEAQEAHKRGILIPAFLDDVAPPFGFRMLHAHDLTGWNGSADSPELGDLLRAIAVKARPTGAPRTKQAAQEALNDFHFEAEFWRTVATAEPQSIKEYEAYLARFGPESQFAGLARSRIERLAAESSGQTARKMWKVVAGGLGLVGTVVSIAVGVEKLLSDAPPEGAVRQPAPTDALAPHAEETYRLTLELTPPDAAVDFVNLDLEYAAGMRLPPGEYVLLITRTGYLPEELSVSITDADRTLPITLSEILPSTPSMILHRVAPDYPVEALARGIEGWVQLDFEITELGSVKEPKVIASDPPGIFEDAAIRAVLGWRYRPATEYGRPVTDHVGTKIVFSLEE